MSDNSSLRVNKILVSDNKKYEGKSSTEEISMKGKGS